MSNFLISACGELVLIRYGMEKHSWIIILVMFFSKMSVSFHIYWCTSWQCSLPNIFAVSDKTVTSVIRTEWMIRVKSVDDNGALISCCIFARDKWCAISFHFLLRVQWAKRWFYVTPERHGGSELLCFAAAITRRGRWKYT